MALNVRRPRLAECISYVECYLSIIRNRMMFVLKMVLSTNDVVVVMSKRNLTTKHAFTECILLFCATISSYKIEIEYRFIKWTNFLCMNVCHSKEKNFKAWIYYIIPFDCFVYQHIMWKLTQLDLQRECQWHVFKAKTCREKLFKWRNDFFLKMHWNESRKTQHEMRKEFM